MGIHGAATWPLAASGGLAAAASLYLVALAMAALFPRSRGMAESLGSRLVVIVPAHDEEELLGRCLASLRYQTYPPGRYRIVVVADNCTDSTAAVAKAGGAEVLVRDRPDARGKGRALRWAMDLLLAGPQPADAFVVVDADSVADHDLLRALEAHLAAGAEVVQAEYLVLAEPGAASELRQAAFLLFHRTRFTGRDSLGMACNLAGNGMLFARSVLERVPWDAFSATEDLEYSIDLRLAGISPRFAPAARISGPAPGSGRAAGIQRMRWEGGRFHLVRTRLGPVVAAAVHRRDWSLLDAAADLAVPPLGLLVLLTLGGSLAAMAAWASGLAAPWVAAIWAVAAAGIAVYVVLGLRAAHAPASAYRALLATPLFLLAKAGTYVRMTRGLHAERWERTERPGESRRRVADRVDVCGVPIDVVDQGAAVERIMAAVAARSFAQVTTVNLQFLVTARRRPEVRRVLREAGVSVADGLPVVWLARLLGHRLPERVAGADLVPALMTPAAARGTRVFLLGGSGGAAADAATVLTARHPGLVIAGTYEPPFTPLGRMPDETILNKIGEAHAEILLVAFGHPKQELWIDAQREGLAGVVAIGVGCTLDLIAGRRRRAPHWIRRTGFEWLYRIAQEPRRLLPRYLSVVVWLGVLLPLAGWARLHAGPAVTTRPAPGGASEVASLATDAFSQSPS